MIAIDARCDGSREAGWTCQVTLSDAGRKVSTHEVRVTTADLDRLAPGATDPTDLVDRSFVFLLEREPPTSILRSFDLAVISRYFPEFATEIRRIAGAG